ncbi:ankyrin repeat domain-containing protein [Campylobacter insulaenigrae]|uniref:Ankyrin domain protein n=2 Tax=Campylobacter insulaenigrae TaxID=260714 RepID=A0A0A8GZB0_9BACT|nr:ankyrin repeat domain-containing protein [Campylobacter insulaenigrae]AJC87273.1 ankyrin domain protein [Campylobacter insulaenigrae NCTC 12927]MCR6571327.1 ankyrin repeat domain-containing protein [Campylobacter insulaenigrae]MCR6572666.1 ankyrin repeat domain-containing protein [Campylobacter insulaenigrae]MCR6574050.1 ankyrin repeat domain-containing protein [Campylobacter insulaenigrae]MCR6575391.1 ankyrin repeat domain-containing protein [Campylobacter insulaenigrae]
MFNNEEEQRIQELCTMAFDFARKNDLENLKIMIEAGLSVNLKNHKGDSLLMLSSYHNSYECAQFLLENGARVDDKNDKGQTPLAGVCFKGYLPMCKLLVHYGANIDENNGLGMTPFSFAVMFGHREIVEFLAQNSKKSFLKKLAFFVLKVFKRKKN